MPRRVIRLGLQPSTFSFEDDHGPLVNGLASAAQSFMEGGQRRAELEMARDEKRKQDEASTAALARQANRDLIGDDFKRQELALHTTEATDHRNEHLRDDMGGLLKGVASFFKGSPSDQVAQDRLKLDREKFDFEKGKPVPSKTGSDRFAPDELAHRQMLADREADAAGVTTYEEDPITGKAVRKLAPGKSWNDVLKIYKPYGILPDGIDPKDDPAAPEPAASPSLASTVAQNIAPMPTSGQMRSPSGQILTKTAEGGYVPDGYTPYSKPAWEGVQGSPGELAGRAAFNASQDQSLNPQPGGPQDRYAGETASGKPDTYIMDEIAKDPVRSAVWNRLPPDRLAKYQAIFSLPDGPVSQQAKLRALALFAKEQ